MQEQMTLYGFEVREPDLRRNDRSGSYDIKQLWQRSHEILGLALQGFKQVQIAELLGIHPQTVSNTLNSELGKRKLSEMRKDRDEEIVSVSKEISILSKKALGVYEEIFDGKDISYTLKKETADTVLMDIGGNRAPTKIDQRSVSLHATAQDLERFKDRGLKAAREAGMIVDLPKENENDSVD